MNFSHLIAYLKYFHWFQKSTWINAIHCWKLMYEWQVALLILKIGFTPTIPLCPYWRHEEIRNTFPGKARYSLVYQVRTIIFIRRCAYKAFVWSHAGPHFLSKQDLNYWTLLLLGPGRTNSLNGWVSNLDHKFITKIIILITGTHRRHR